MKCYPYSIRAVKRIKKKHIKNPAAILREYSILTTFDHPQIVKIYETFEDDDNFFLVLEYFDLNLATAKEESCLVDCKRKEIFLKRMLEYFLLKWSIL